MTENKNQKLPLTVTLSNGAVVVETKGYKNATYANIDGREMTHSEWREYCDKVVSAHE